MCEQLEVAVVFPRGVAFIDGIDDCKLTNRNFNDNNIRNLTMN